MPGVVIFYKWLFYILYLEHKDEPDTRKLPQDPIFDVDTALNKEKPNINADNVLALSETAKALEKDLKKFQNYYGFNQDQLTNHAAKEVERTGESRFQITKPVVQQKNTHTPKYMAATRPKIDKKVKKGKAAEYMSVMPNGPTSLVSEIQGILTTEVGSKRMQISADKRVPDGKKLSIKNNPNSFSKYHRAPVVRNENKVLPFGPHAYFQLPNIPQAPSEFARGLVKSSFPHNPKSVKIIGPSAFLQRPAKVSRIIPKSNVAENKLDPRWFTWTKGLATTNGVTTTNTHSNSNQKEPGSVSMNNHVTSSQQSKGSTDVKNRYDVPKNLIVANGNLKYLILNPASVSPNTLMELQRARDIAVQKTRVQTPVNANANVQILQLQRARQIAAQKRLQADRLRYAKQKQVALNTQKAHQILVQKNAAILRAQQVQQAQQTQQAQQAQQLSALQKKEVHTTEHKHQWGFGNGNGNGNGVGTPGASGSGGGWGTGGPLSSNVNFPGWGGNPPNQNRFTPQGTENAPMAPVTREMWNTFLAQRRQSNSNVNAETVNTAQSSVEIQPANGIQNGKVSAHQWGFGNGQGQGTGQGSPGGTGNGGGWGAGGPTKQNTWLPNQRSVIHSSTLPIAIAESFKVPWLPQINDKMNNAHALSAHADIRRQFPYAMTPNLNSFQVIQMQRSHIPSSPLNPQSKYHVMNPPQQIMNRRKVLQKSYAPPLNPNNYQYMSSQNLEKSQLYIPYVSLTHSQPLTLAKHSKISKRMPIQRMRYHEEYVVPPSVQTQVYPLYQDRQLYSLKSPSYLKSSSYINPHIKSALPAQKRTRVSTREGAIPYRNYHRSEVLDPLSKHMTPQGIIETLPFLKRK